MNRLPHLPWTLLGCLALSSCGDAELPLGPDRDGDNWPEDLDCEDGDPSVFPAADEIPDDGIDQDCSGADATIHGSGGGENCSGDDCGGAAGAANGAGGTGNGTGGEASTLDVDGDGHSAAPYGDDCDDERPDVHPDAREVVLNGIDEDCDGSDLVGGDRVIPILSVEAEPAMPPDLARAEFEGEPALLAVWSDSRTAPQQDLYGQLFDLTGEAIGAEIEIDTSDNAAKTGVRIASSGDGFLVTWSTADGVWVRRVSADGSPEGTVLGFGGVGATDPVPAYSSGHWAVAWRRPVDGRAEVRAMTIDAARGDIFELGDGEISSASLTGTDEGFVAVWEGPIDDEERGLLAQRRTVTAHPDGAQAAVFEGAASAPTIGRSGDQLLVAFSLSGSFGFAAAQRFGLDLVVADPAAPTRLSAESVNQSAFHIVPPGEDFLVLWNDERHASHAPPAQSVYGNRLGADGVAFPSGTAYLAAEQAQLGGTVLVDDAVYSVVVDANGPGLFVIEP